MESKLQQPSWQPRADASILVINSGSSSVKFALFTIKGLERMWSGAIERIGLADSRLYVFDEKRQAKLINDTRRVADHKVALKLLLNEMDRHPSVSHLAAVGHRVVHGGSRYDRPVIITPRIEAQLGKLNQLAPMHQPHNLAGIAAVRIARPKIPQVACFDTAFHSSLPRLARLTALPRRMYAQKIRRYGFHGLSYEYIADALRHDQVDLDQERVIIAHLGNGASMCALKAGQSVETTMGFSTLSGLPMGTRCGDLDPGIILYLLTAEGMTAKQVQHLLYEQSGLLGISHLSPSMEDLLKQTSKPEAAEAIDFYCYQARRQLAALTATLGGLDRLVFTGGIGANAPLIRSKICDDLTYLGISLDAKRNTDSAKIVSNDDSSVTVEAFATDEELMIARHVRNLLRGKSENRE
jgi:acetate kinase